MEVLMCPPKYFGIQAEDKNVNPWMKKANQPDRNSAMRQWQGLEEFYRTQGLNVRFLEPQPELFDQVFTANLAWGRERKMVLASLNPEWRRKETAYVARWFLENDYELRFLPEGLKFEGQGDVISLDDDYFLYCYGIRNDLAVLESLEEILDLKGRFIPLKLVNPQFYHGDVCIRYSKHRRALLFNPSAFDAESLRKLEHLPVPVQLMEAPPELWVQETPDGRNFPLNGCYVGEVETFPWDVRCSDFPWRTQQWIEDGGGQIWLQNFDQFGLSGAGQRCCSLFLD